MMEVGRFLSLISGAVKSLPRQLWPSWGLVLYQQLSCRHDRPFHVLDTPSDGAVSTKSGDPAAGTRVRFGRFTGEPLEDPFRPTAGATPPDLIGHGESLMTSLTDCALGQGRRAR